MKKNMNTKINTKLKVNDQVVVISGADRGRRGKVLLVDPQRARIVIEGVNKRNKFVRATQEGAKSGMVSMEFPINISNVMIFCEKCKKGRRVGIERKENSKTRVCKKCGKSLD